MTEVHRYKAVKMLSEAGNRISYDPHGPFVVMAEAYDQLKAENEALRKDAERYRWLRDPDAQEDLSTEYSMPPIICAYAEDEDILTKAALDRAIDAGIEETKS